MKPLKLSPAMALLFLLTITTIATHAAPPATRPQLLGGKDVLPIAVWLQDPRNAAKYHAIGINLYVGLWAGPKESQLEALQRAGMPVVCAQNEESLKDRWKSEVLGFLQDDEPDNAQELGKGKGYGPPVPTDEIVERYRKMKAADPRPVMLNLGQGVAWDAYYGRGVRSRHPEDYPQYALGGDLVSFDIYPVTHERADVAGKLWYVGRGVQRLADWTDHRKPIWSCIGCTHISNPTVKPTPEQVRAEVWMALIHGARGITYFAHEFKPKFIEAGLLADAEMAEAVRKINEQVQELAPVILDDPPPQQATAPADNGGESAIALTTRHHGGATYVFAIGMTDQTTTARMHLPAAAGEVTVLGEDRQLPITDRGWEDTFKGYDVHLYSVRAPAK